MVGRTISHYKVLSELGRGGMGVVYKAEDTKLKRIVALKFLRAEALEDEELKVRFLREAQAAAALNHPNICTVYEINEADGNCFIAMEWVEGQSIKEKIKERPLKLDEAIDITIQAGRGLQTAHKRGITHRDIKSANLMLVSWLWSPSCASPKSMILFVAKTGRVLVWPIYKGTYERQDGLASTWPNETHQYSDYVTSWVQDLRRTIDYLATRDDIDRDKLAYLGLSWGGRMGAIGVRAESGARKEGTH